MAGIFLILLACFAWAIDTLIRYPLVESGLSPITIVFYEHVILSILFSWGVFAAFKRIGELKLADVFSFFVVGCLGSGLATVAFTQSFHYLNPSLVILLQKLQPVIAISLSALVLKEPVDKKFVIWAAICLVGGFLVSSPDIERFYRLMVSDFSLVISDAAVHGYALVLVSIVGWGSATVFGKKLTIAGFETKSILAGRFLAGLIALIPFMTWNRGLILTQGEDYLRILIMVLISGALGMWFYYQGLKRINAKTAAIAEMFFPFFAILVNWIFLGKQLSDVQLAGGALLVLGSLVIQLKKY
ncbi:MAG: DMT family transporter [Bacteriovoracaceae bacterium]